MRKNAMRPAPVGRPSAAATGVEKLTTGSFRRTALQAEKLEALGAAAGISGGDWLRKQIDAAPWPRGARPR